MQAQLYDLHYCQRESLSDGAKDKLKLSLIYILEFLHPNGICGIISFVKSPLKIVSQPNLT